MDLRQENEALHQRVLVVDFDPHSRQLTSTLLRRSGYFVDIAISTEDADRKLSTHVYACMMIEMRSNADDLLRLIASSRRLYGLPILLTDCEPQYRTIVIELGADEYCMRPWSERELVLRLGKLIERHYLGNTTSTTFIRWGAFAYRPSERCLVRLDQHGDELLRLVLSNIQGHVFHMLMRARGRPLSREQLGMRPHGKEPRLSNRSIDMTVSRMRPKLSKMGMQLQSIRCFGYALSIEALQSQSINMESSWDLFGHQYGHASV
jgi:DNA-binding response OmpR family regulator